MMKNSPSRIAKRRKGALTRRTVDLKMWSAKLLSGGDMEKEFSRKIGICKTDIENLDKKGIRE